MVKKKQFLACQRAVCYKLLWKMYVLFFLVQSLALSDLLKRLQLQEN